jgi:quinol monooxygenase YgiN
VYNDRAAFEQHTTTPHFHRWRATASDWVSEPNQVSFANSIVLSEDTKG